MEKEQHCRDPYDDQIPYDPGPYPLPQALDQIGSVQEHPQQEGELGPTEQQQLLPDSFADRTVQRQREMEIQQISDKVNASTEQKHQGPAVVFDYSDKDRRAEHQQDIGQNEPPGSIVGKVKQQQIAKKIHKAAWDLGIPCQKADQGKQTHHQPEMAEEPPDAQELCLAIALLFPVKQQDLGISGADAVDRNTNIPKQANIVKSGCRSNE